MTDRRAAALELLQEVHAIGTLIMEGERPSPAVVAELRERCIALKDPVQLALDEAVWLLADLLGIAARQVGGSPEWPMDDAAVTIIDESLGELWLGILAGQGTLEQSE